MRRRLTHPSPKPAVVRAGRPPAAAPPARREHGGFPIVGIGASAGGLEALEEFLRHVPAGSGLAFEDLRVPPDRAAHGPSPARLRELLDQKW